MGDDVPFLQVPFVTNIQSCCVMTSCCLLYKINNVNCDHDVHVAQYSYT